MEMTEFEKAKEFRTKVNKVTEKIIDALDPADENDVVVIIAALHKAQGQFIVQLRIGDMED